MFDVDPSQIEALESKPLVILLGRLLHAEALSSGLDLSGISVPLQITVPDGGEDGRITWKEGVAKTDYLPARTNFFQAKAGRIGRIGWKKECWTKSTQAKGKTRAITPVLDQVLGLSGCYIGFTSEALVGSKRDLYVAAIREGIAEAGRDPDKLAAVDIYDANKIAAWATRHPAVAIWLAELAHKQTFAGFRTVQGWGFISDFVDNAFVEDDEPRFAIGGRQELDAEGDDNRITAKAAWERILEHVAKPRKLVRVVGPSGLGKSRFAYEALRSSKSQLSEIFKSTTIFADYRVVAGNLLPTASTLADTGIPALLVVDECPRDIAIALGSIASASTSELRVLTIDTDDRPLEELSTLHVALKRSKGLLVEAIIRKKNSGVDSATVDRLLEICGGYPRFAVLAAGNPHLRASDFETTADVIDRILSGASIRDASELRALQCLSLFESVSIDGEGAAGPLDMVARELARMSGDEMYEHLAKGLRHGLVGRNAGELAAQPLPIALHLALRRLDLIRPSVLVHFIMQSPDELALALLRQWKNLDMSPVVIDVASRLLLPAGELQPATTILTPRGSAVINALVHILPDRVADLLGYRLSNYDFAPEAGPLDYKTRRNLITALEKLVFRKRSFVTAARLLLRLAANETETYANNATGNFTRLFQLQLSGTEAAPADRFVVLDEGLAGESPSAKAVCVEALSAIFDPSPIRFGDAAQIGSGEPLKDWAPETWEEVHEFYRSGLARLVTQRQSGGETSARCERIIAAAARQMLSTAMYREFGLVLMQIAADKGGWPEAIEGVGNWLYFDRDGAPEEHRAYVRDLYSRLFPTDKIERAIVFTKFWTSDIRDPDVTYAENDSDFGYSEREARKIAKEIAADHELALETVQRMTPLDLKTVLPFAEQLALDVIDKSAVFRIAVETFAEKRGSVAMLRGLLRGIDLLDPPLADECAAEAILQLGDKVPRADLYSALTMTDERLDRFIADLRSGAILPTHAAYLSYGRGLDNLNPEKVALLLEELPAFGGDGAWTALEVAMMYRYGQPLGPAHTESIARLLVRPELLESTKDARRNTHVFEDLARRIGGTIGSNETLAGGLARQVIRLVEGEDYNLLNSLAKAMRQLVAQLSEKAPEVIWEYVSRFYDNATPIERNRLKRIIGSDSYRFDENGTIDAGPIFGVPEALVLAWADASDSRPEFLVEFYPIMTPEGEERTWHPAFAEVAARYGTLESFRKALSRRIRPTSWSGSIIPLLEIFLKPLKSWFKHPVQPLATWAQQEHASIERRIEREVASGG